MLPDCYSAGWERKPFDVCGRKLAPMTLGHARVLYLAGSPYAVPESSSTSAEALMLAVCICARAVAPAFTELATLAHEATLLKAEDFTQESKRFEEYMAYYCSTPMRWPDESAKARMPWPWALYSAMRRFYSMRDDHAWGMICSDAFVLLAAVAIQNGDTKYATIAETDIAMELGDL